MDANQGLCYYLLREGSTQQWGPLDFEDLQAFANEGKIHENTWVCVGEGGQALRASQIKGLFEEEDEWLDDSAMPSSPYPSNYPRAAPAKSSFGARRDRFIFWAYALSLLGFCFWPLALAAVCMGFYAKRKRYPEGVQVLSFASMAALIGALIWIPIVIDLLRS